VGFQANQLEQFVDAALPVGCLPVCDAKGDVLRDIKVWEQREVLEDEADIAVLRGEEGAVACDGLAGDGECPLGRFGQPGDEPERGRFATPRGAEESEEFAVFDGQREVFDGRFRAEAFGDPRDFEDGVRVGLCASCRFGCRVREGGVVTCHSCPVRG